MARKQLKGQRLTRQQIESDDQHRVVAGKPTAAEESEELINGHTRDMTTGSTSVQTSSKNQLLVDIDGIKFNVPRGVGEELLAQLSRALRPYAGYSIFDVIMMELDAVLDRMMAGNPSDDGRDPGRGEAFTMCLAAIRNPYEPDYEEEKRRQMERWRKRNKEGHIG